MRFPFKLVKNASLNGTYEVPFKITVILKEARSRFAESFLEGLNGTYEVTLELVKNASLNGTYEVPL